MKSIKMKFLKEIFGLSYFYFVKKHSITSVKPKKNEKKKKNKSIVNFLIYMIIKYKDPWWRFFYFFCSWNIERMLQADF